MATIQVKRTPLRFYPDSTRTITRRLFPSGGRVVGGSKRLDAVLMRIMALPEAEVHETLDLTFLRFAHRHHDFIATLESNFAAVAGLLGAAGLLSAAGPLSKERRRLIGAYLTQEYSLEGASLTNPSMVLAPDQSGLRPGESRILLSLRSIGEGHISSIQFRSGRVDAAGGVEIDRPGPHPRIASHRPATFLKAIFREKLIELHVYGEIAATVLDALGDEFTMDELNVEIDKANGGEQRASEASRATRALHWLAASNYESQFPENTEVSERVLFPAGPTESNGMEDARFTRFVHADGRATYFATYTAYDGYEILPQLIETPDFLRFRIATLNGAGAKNKGIALFPRMVGGKFMALSRIDNENNYLMTSDNIHFWHEATVLHGPRRPWELTHVGNCGSPLETEAGWLVITHGVGPMRRYALGAILLDLDEPTRIIGSLREPLLEPENGERDGYVPNVAYSCGSMIQGDYLILPYGFSDSGTGIATVVLAELLAELRGPRNAVN